MWNSKLDESQYGIQCAGRNINNLRYTDDTTLIAEREEEQEPLDESERRKRKSWLKTQHSKNEDHGIQSHHLMADRRQRSENSDRFSLALKSLWMVTAAMKLKDTWSLEEKLLKDTWSLEEKLYKK